jgi:hypothetical protein
MVGRAGTGGGVAPRRDATPGSRHHAPWARRGGDERAWSRGRDRAQARGPRRADRGRQQRAGHAGPSRAGRASSRGQAAEPAAGQEEEGESGRREREASSPRGRRRRGRAGFGAAANDSEGRGANRTREKTAGVVGEMNRDGFGAYRRAPHRAAAAAGQPPSTHAREESGASCWGRLGRAGGGGSARPRHDAELDREPASRPRRGGGTRGPREKGGRARWAARGGNTPKREGRKRREKEKVFSNFNLFSKSMFSQIQSTNKIDAWTGMVQQPKDLTLGFTYMRSRAKSR